MEQLRREGQKEMEWRTEKAKKAVRMTEEENYSNRKNTEI